MSELTQCDNPKDGLKYFSKNYPKLKIVLTLGSEGSMYSDTEKVVFQPSFKVCLLYTSAQGFGVIMISSEMPEVLGMADTILVMKEGRVSKIFADATGVTQEQILEAAMNM